MSDPQSSPLRIGFVPGVTPGKWVGRWRDRHPRKPVETTEYDDGPLASALRDGSVDIAFMRLPVDRESLSLIPLYEEQAVVVASKEHELSLFEDVLLTDLAAENLLDVAECGGFQSAVEVAASGAGVVILPMSVARLHSRRDMVARPVTDGPVTAIGVAWLADHTTEDIEEFIGIVRGRTERSSRQPSAQKEPAPKKKPTARGATSGKPRGMRGPNKRGKPGAPGRGRRPTR
ncbi:LysR family transcriptional regulator substrate-binding protein [Arthrobacter sp. H5]|uniref:LysR family transcriptional regulator substrate-binding protein n=2 Tax=Arthrobacter sp. H5 TaxID=1267973 RepID=UPI0020A653BF|nr:LysR family transcriptional regulator substrate-binding protein [Arthrobacter sp. H5]